MVQAGVRLQHREVVVSVLQVSGGKRERDYHEWFIQNDVAAIGPGGVGAWDPDRPADFDGLGKRALKAFYEAQIGQTVVLTLGMEVRSVGVIERTARFVEDMKLFGNWDLLHVMRVRWADPAEPEFGRMLERAPNYQGGQKPRACNLSRGNGDLAQWAASSIDQLRRNVDWSERPLSSIPLSDPPLNMREARKLIPNGLDAVEIANIIDRSGDVWSSLQRRRWTPPSSENEIVALIVVPFLIALGWQPRNLALEWHPRGRLRADVAAFSSDRRTHESCRLLVEAKAPGTGLVYAKSQLFNYARGNEADPPLDVPIIATDGFTWALYKNAWASKTDGEIFMPELRLTAGEFLTKVEMIAP